MRELSRYQNFFVFLQKTAFLINDWQSSLKSIGLLCDLQTVENFHIICGKVEILDRSQVSMLSTKILSGAKSS